MPRTFKQALTGVKVLDLTHYVAGPYCTKLLADYGAEVIKLEKPGCGDGARRLGPFPDDKPHPEKSGLFLHLNTNKKGITLNLKCETGIQIFHELIQWADIVAENFKPGVMPSLGLDFESLRELKPNIVMTSISNFGKTGPYRDYEASEIVLYGMGGAMNSTGTPEQPLKLAGFLTQYHAGTVAAVATMGALFAGKFQGIGQHVDVSIMEAEMSSADRRALNTLSFAYSRSTLFFRSLRMGLFIMPHGRYPCADGFVEFTGGEPSFWPRWIRMLGMPELADDPRFQDLADLTHKDELEAIFLDWLADLSKDEVMKIAQREGVPGAMIQDVKELVDDDHFNEREFFTEIEHPEAGKFKYPGAPFKMAQTPWAIRMPAPLLGQNNEEVYRDLLGYTEEDLVELKAAGVI